MHFIVLLIILLAGNSLFGQAKCGFNPNPAIYQSAVWQKINREAHFFTPSFKSSSDTAIFTIPVVVHILYDNETVNISDEQVVSQIDVLNADFRDAKIRFFLAKADENCRPTTGITRTQTACTRFDTPTCPSPLQIIQWNAYRYFNIYVVETPGVGNTLGYCTVPDTTKDSGFNEEVDGVVIGYKYFGTNGTAVAPYHLGRTTTHEVGHWLGLKHLFEQDDACRGVTRTNCYLEGDFVCDTPPQKVNHKCPATAPNTCIETPIDRPDLIDNYMGYNPDVCMKSFTQGQKNRMWYFLTNLRQEIWSENNIRSTQHSCTSRENSLIAAQSILSIYPNPASERLYLQGIPANCHVTIYDALGAKRIEKPATTNNIDVRALPAGVYTVHVVGRGVAKFVKL